MKRLLPLACLLLAGCTMKPAEPKIIVFDQISDTTGNHRLLLKLVQEQIPTRNKGEAYNFHSLVWETGSDAAWVEKVVIARADFQKGAANRRWVSKVHSFDPEVGRAVVQVGEEGQPDENGAVRVTYSWREWDIANNQEVRLIRVCASPFEPFEKAGD